MSPSPQTTTSPARLRATLWLIGSVLPTVGLMVYLTLSSSANPSLAQLSEEPHLFTSLLIACTFASVWIVLAPSRRFFPPRVLHKMQLGSAAGVVGLLFYSFYVYSFSALPPAPNAPSVGEQAPDFTVTDPDARDWTLSEFKGDVLVFFYRGHW